MPLISGGSPKFSLPEGSTHWTPKTDMYNFLDGISVIALACLGICGYVSAIAEISL